MEQIVNLCLKLKNETNCKSVCLCAFCCQIKIAVLKANRKFCIHHQMKAELHAQVVQMRSNMGTLLDLGRMPEFKKIRLNAFELGLWVCSCMVCRDPLPLKHIQSYPLLPKLVHRTGIETYGVEDVLQTVPEHSKGGSPNDLHRSASLMTMNCHVT